MQGQIAKIISDLHFVKYDNKIYPCKCRGILSHEHITPLVGEYVLFDENELIINEILPRKNSFERPKVCNIDQAFIITSLALKDKVKNPYFILLIGLPILYIIKLIPFVGGLVTFVFLCLGIGLLTNIIKRK